MHTIKGTTPPIMALILSKNLLNGFREVELPRKKKVLKGKK